MPARDEDIQSLLDQMHRRSSEVLHRMINQSRGSWLTMPDEIVGNMLIHAVGGLLRATATSGNWEVIAKEAADVYHIASMGADPKRLAVSRAMRGVEGTEILRGD